ncbi:MAG: amidase [Anaerolineales bacterium]|nr:amidase [Anaerolineales bacterium]
MNEQMSLSHLVEALRTGQKPLAVYLDELEARFAAREAEVLAFVPEDGRFARLRQEAAQLAQTYPDPQQRPPLFGVPVAVKDIFHVDGFVTRAGCRLPAALLQGDESPLVTQLRTLGALILGKTVTTEFAFFAPGPTRNPHNLAHTPGGSSSGSAAAVAAGLAPLALGSQTIGSINRPAAYCGVVGFKPSYERLTKAGVLPLSPSADTVGLFTADVAGMITAVTPLLAHEPRTVSRPTLGIPLGPYLEQATAVALAHFEETVARLAAAGFPVRRVPVMADFARIDALHRDLVAAEAAQVHAIWYAQHASLYHAKTADLIEKGRKITPERMRESLNNRSVLRSALQTAMDAEGIDLWLSPPAPGTAPVGLESTGDPVMNLPWTHAGMPTLTLPVSFAANGLPLGLQLAARFGADEALLPWALQLEAALRGAS